MYKKNEWLKEKNEEFPALTSLQRFKNQNRNNFQLLTDRETVILSLVALGLHHSTIAQKLDISGSDVQELRNNIQEKLSIHQRADYIKYAFAFGLISF